VAGIMMAGIISDTLLLNSPTTTAVDKELLAWLEPIAGIKPKTLADLIFTAGSVVVNNPPADVIRSDCKTYVEGELRFSVSQIEELGFDNFWANEEALEAALTKYRIDEDLYCSLLLITDINSQDSLLLVAADDEFHASIDYPQRGQNNIYELSGIVSRKKQLMPYLTSLLKTMGVV
jgi:manganese-dependent inorganic pyrophosphatase